MIIVVEKRCRTHHNKNLALLNFWKHIFIPGRAGEIIFSICVTLMKNPGGGIAELHALEAVSKSQPLKHNGERALTANACSPLPNSACYHRTHALVGRDRSSFRWPHTTLIHSYAKFPQACGADFLFVQAQGGGNGKSWLAGIDPQAGQAAFR